MKRYAILVATLPFWGIFGSATADVTIKSKAEFKLMLGIGNGDSDMTTYIKGDKNRTETTTEFKSRMFGNASQEDMTSKTTEIYRLDKGVVWNLESRDETYREIFLKSLNPAQGGLQGSPQDSPQMTGDPANYVWTSDLDISRESEVINGFKSRKAIVNAVGVHKDDKSDSMFVTLKMWNSEEVPKLSEIESYYDKFSEITGFEKSPGTGNIGSYSAGFGDEFAESAKKIEKLEGFTVKTEMLVQKSSAADNSESGQMDFSDLMKGMMKPGEKGEKKSAGKTTIISITNEVISVDDSAVDDKVFEIPEEYVRKE